MRHLMNKNVLAIATMTLCTLTMAGPAMADAIQDKYAAMGGSGGPLGAPTSGYFRVTASGALYQKYVNGAIYEHPQLGTHAIYGAIYAKWVAMGRYKSPVGYPKSDELDAGDGRGRYNYFEHGIIVWSPQTGANAVWGDIGAKYLQSGGIAGYGYPVTDELPTPDGVGRYNHFDRGNSIYWTPNTGAHLVYGAIRHLWAQMGWERSYLGYPRTDEMDVAGGGRINYFQGGVIFWTPQGGAIAYRN